MNKTFLAVCASLAIAASGCNPHFTPVAAASTGSLTGDETSNEDGSFSEPSLGELPSAPPSSDPSGEIGSPKTPTDPIARQICSRLDLTDIRWPESLDDAQNKTLALGLNITGSFEGNRGWANITNNFDDQGMSLGLLQQNFGQGSLQPLLITMFEQHLDTMRSVFAPDHLGSLHAMLMDWMGGPLAPRSRGIPSIPSELFPDTEGLSPLDQGFDESAADESTGVGEPLLHIMNTSANRQSVSWAVDTLFQDNGRTFVPSWKQGFQSLAVTAPYRTLQVHAAVAMFVRAIGYAESFGFTELRSVLTMYDYVVQNGGFNSTHRNLFQEYRSTNPNASETARLLKLLEIRLVSVRPQYRADVKARKTTIVNGRGTVHGAKRDLPKEYCYNPKEVIF